MEKVQNYVEGSNFLCIAGIATVLWAVSKILYDVISHFAIYHTDLRKDLKSYGEWAVVTGATDGIGKGIARELAKQGINIVLIGRNPSKLETVSDELKREFRVETKCILFDFTYSDVVSGGKQTSSVYYVISSAIRGLDIGIVVNNVGMSVGKVIDFLNSCKTSTQDSDMVENIVNCNVTSITKMTQLVLSEMVRRKKGLVINLSSIIGLNLAPFSALYSSTKRFDDTFSRALSYEYEKHGIVVQSVCPGLVATNMTKKAKVTRGTRFFPLCETYVSSLIKTTGKSRRTAGYWFHALIMYIYEMLPASAIGRMQKKRIIDMKSD